MNVPHVKAVMFDLGGVVLKSPFVAIAHYEKEHGLPSNYLNVSITFRGSSGAWQRFERGELSLLNFYTAFGRDLSDTANGNKWYTEYCKQKQVVCPELPEQLRIDGRDLFGRMMRSAMAYDAHMLTAIRNLRDIFPAAGKWHIIALTNNFGVYHDTKVEPSQEIPETELRFLGWEDGPVPKHLRELFDHFYDSSQVGMRKPDPRFYLHACKESGVNPEDVIFLDDIGMNLKTAKELGMVTIRAYRSVMPMDMMNALMSLSRADIYVSDVPIGGTLQAVKQLENYLGIDLCSGTTKGYSEGTKL